MTNYVSHPITAEEYTKLDDNSKFYTLVIDKVDGKFRFQFMGNAYTFDPSLIYFSPDMCHIANSVKGMYLYWGSGVEGDKAALWQIRMRNNSCNGFHHLCSIFINSDLSLDLVVRQPALLINLDYVDLEGALDGKSTEEVLSLYNEECAGFEQRHKAKFKMLDRISPSDSLAMLESQLDLLTKIVLGEDESGEYKEALKTATDGKTVDTVHTLEKIIRTISRQKNRIRDVVNTYMEERGSFVNNDPNR